MARPRSHAMVLRRGTYAGGAIGAYRALKYAPTAAKRINQTVRNLFARSKDTPSGASAGPLTTFQQDTKVTYKRKRAPRRVRIAARKASRRFEKNLTLRTGLKTIITNRYLNIEAADGLQANYDLPFLPSSTINTVFNTVLDSGDLPATTSVTGPAVNTSGSEIMFGRCHQEVEILNAGTGLCFVDLYYYYPRKDLPFTTPTYLSDISAVANTSVYKDNQRIATGGDGLRTNLSMNGVTPFMFPNFTENFVIYKTRRVMLQGGQSFSYIMKGGPIGNQTNKDWLGLQLRRKVSSGVLLIGQGTLGTANDATTVGVDLRVHIQEYIGCYKLAGTTTRSQAISLSYTPT
ncbi:MAG: capsid protein [Cressdnaviricota sp.]|nr:MAG: capsid protein [Cressdnaviricota sp.]